MEKCKIEKIVRDFFREFETNCSNRDDLWATLVDYGYGQDALVDKLYKELNEPDQTDSA